MKTKTKLILGLISFCLILSFIITTMIIKFDTNLDLHVTFLSFSNNSSNRLKCSYKYFNGTDTKSINLKKNESINIDYTSTVTKGNLKILVLDTNGETIKALDSNISSLETINAKEDETIKIRVEGHNTKGSYDIHWTKASIN